MKSFDMVLNLSEKNNKSQQSETSSLSTVKMPSYEPT